MAKNITENMAESSILSWLKANNIFAWKNSTGGYFDVNRKIFRKQVSEYSINGSSDILGILPDGFMLAIEVKSPTRKKKNGEYQKNVVSDDQQYFIEMINENKGIGMVASSIEDVEKELNAKGYSII